VHNEEHFALSAAQAWFYRACKALGHPARLRVIELLASGECICGSLVDRLPLAQSTVSQHLKVLRDTGLIRGEIEGPRTCYCLDREAVEKFAELAAGLGCRASLAASRAGGDRG